MSSMIVLIASFLQFTGFSSTALSEAIPQETQTTKPLKINNAAKSDLKALPQKVTATKNEIPFVIRDRIAFSQSRTGKDRYSIKDREIVITRGFDFKGAISSEGDFLEEIINASEEHIVFYIHGYSVPHKYARETAQVIQRIAEGKIYNDRSKKGGKNVLVIPIIWGSFQNHTCYPCEISRVGNSSAAVGNLFLNLNKKRLELKKSHKRFHLIAHSLGNRLAKTSFAYMKGKDHSKDVFTSINSVAADISDKALREKDASNFLSVSKDSKIKDRVFFFRSKLDISLMVSNIVRVILFQGHSSSRCGTSTTKFVEEGIRMVDCKSVSRRDPAFNHSYILKEPNAEIIPDAPSSHISELSRCQRHTETLHAILTKITKKSPPAETLQAIDDELLLSFCER